MNNTIDQHDLDDIHGSLCPTIAGTFTKTPYLDHTANLNKFKRI